MPPLAAPSPPLPATNSSAHAQAELGAHAAHASQAIGLVIPFCFLAFVCCGACVFRCAQMRRKRLLEEEEEEEEEEAEYSDDDEKELHTGPKSEEQMAEEEMAEEVTDPPDLEAVTDAPIEAPHRQSTAAAPAVEALTVEQPAVAAAASYAGERGSDALGVMHAEVDVQSLQSRRISGRSESVAAPLLSHRVTDAAAEVELSEAGAPLTDEPSTKGSNPMDPSSPPRRVTISSVTSDAQDASRSARLSSLASRPPRSRRMTADRDKDAPHEADSALTQGVNLVLEFMGLEPSTRSSKGRSPRSGRLRSAKGSTKGGSRKVRPPLERRDRSSGYTPWGLMPSASNELIGYVIRKATGRQLGPQVEEKAHAIKKARSKQAVVETNHAHGGAAQGSAALADGPVVTRL